MSGIRYETLTFTEKAFGEVVTLWLLSKLLVGFSHVDWLMGRRLPINALVVSLSCNWPAGKPR
jgi:hypothetical protein